MNSGRSNIGKCVVLSVSMIYLFMSLSYIFFLPKLNRVWLTKQTPASALSVCKNGNQTTAIEAHKLYKSVPENRRNSVIPKFLTLLLIGLMVARSGMSQADFLRATKYVSLAYIKTRSFYIIHCPLRMWMIPGVGWLPATPDEALAQIILGQAYSKQHMASILNIID